MSQSKHDEPQPEVFTKERKEKLTEKMSELTKKPLELLDLDMNDDMLAEAVIKADNAIDKFEMEMNMAEYIKKSFDKMFSPPWHVVVGHMYGSSVVHDNGTFANFILGDMGFLIYRGMS
ncbi:unnamed protein product [Soboliphyme baturini]|uniref:Dynein light chain n=1 Tax=Soboliphyme baturini TaxID=241478 RepID=A0A183IID4_9BILA|nr:unnamed protein product [Soboliphyme baturini]